VEWLPITLLCAFSLASADAATKRWLQDAGAREITLLRYGLAGLFLSPLAFHDPLPDLPAAFWGWIAMLVPLELLAALLYMRAIRDFALSATLPYLAFTPVFVTLTGWLVLGERVDAQGFGGILLVVAGSWWLNAGSGRLTWRELLRPFRAILHNTGSRLMLLVAFIYSLTSVGGKAAMQWLPAETFGPLYFVLVGGGAALLFGASRPAAFGVLVRHPFAGILVAVLSAVMVFTHFIALEMVEAAYMIAVKRTSLLFGIIYGALFFAEPNLRRSLAAGALMIGGVFLILA
jgi:drug/metabolite transporter (DMT)-like permease